MAEKSSEDAEFQRWTAKRKASLVIDIIKGKTTLAEACRQRDQTPSEIEEWR